MPTNSGYEWIKKEEGFAPVAKKLKTQSGLTERVRTVGYGYNIDAQDNPIQDMMNAGINSGDAEKILAGKRAISKEEAGRLYNLSVSRAANQTADIIPNLADQPGPIKDVLVAMTYQMGRDGLKGFRKMRAALAVNDYKGMAKEILDSKFARENSTSRAKRTAKRVLDYADSLPPPPKQKSQFELNEEAKKDATAMELAGIYSSNMLEQDLTSLFKQMKSNETQENNQEGEE